MIKPTVTFGAIAGGVALAASAGSPQVTRGKPIMVSYDSYMDSASREARSVSAGGALEMDEALLNAKLEAVEARTETKFAQLIGKIEVIGERISGLSADISAVKSGLSADITTVKDKVGLVDGHVRSAKGTITAFVIGTGIAVAALAYSAVQVFEGGMGATQAAVQTGVQLGASSNGVTTGSPQCRKNSGVRC